MASRIKLTDADIVTYVRKKPGAYILVGNTNNPIYVGRSDTNLQGRLLQHLPGVEQNSCIARKHPTEIYFENTETAWEAYRLECEWYRQYNPPCNDVAPRQPAG